MSGPNWRLRCGPGGLRSCVWHNGTREEKEAWQLLPQADGCQGGAFATLVSGERYVDPAVCLRAQLRLVGTRCPVVALWDDRPDQVSEASRRKLVDAFGNESMQPLTPLLNRVGRDNPPDLLEVIGRQKASATPGRRRDGPLGRRLYSSSEWNRLYIKLFFWAMDPSSFARIVILDSDVIVRQNLDALLSHAFHERNHEPIAGVPCQDDDQYFNTGVVVLRPSLKTLAGLLRTHPGRKCESKITDQSVMNLFFAKRWDRLRRTYNVPHFLLSGVPAAFWQHASVAVLHFTSEPKPWDAPSTLRKAVKHHYGKRGLELVNEYRGRCGLSAVA